VLTPEVRDTFAYVENGSGHLLLTGKAGTGKSTWLHFFALHTQKNFVVLAPTGLSAVNVGGATLHSFFGFPLRPLLPNDAEIRRFGRKSGKMDLIQSTDVIIIDEISMVRADVLDAVDYSLRLNLRTDEPFGGKQVVFIGDVFQLPPVVSGQHELERQLYPTLFPNDSPPEGWLFTEGNGAYDSPFFFSARVFRKSPISYQVLKEIFRQRDPEFITLLNRVRQGQPRPEDMQALNSRVVPGYTPPPEHIAVTLVTTNALAKRLNETALEALPGTVRTYNAVREGSFDARWQPADDPLTLKLGAQVLFTRNHPTGLWVNGTLGVVEKLGDDTIVVRTRAGELLEVSPTMWEHTEYVWNKDTRRVDSLIKGTFTQFPLRLAWALTIHKSQGMTFDEVVLDLGRGAFAHGQLYVALSRCRTFQGLTLRQPVRTSDAKVDPVVLEFVRSLPR
jgi:ATP-dependent exoDNAse (exonuclease V) alpha subunit